MRLAVLPCQPELWRLCLLFWIDALSQDDFFIALGPMGAVPLKSASTIFRVGAMNGSVAGWHRARMSLWRSSVDAADAKKAEGASMSTLWVNPESTVAHPVSAEVRCKGVVRLWSVRRLLTRDAAKTLVQASILSRIDYCNSVLNRACAVHLRPLQSVLHSAARLILRIRKYDHISTAIREELHWLPVHHMIQFKTCAQVHKCLHGLALSYLIDMIGLVSKEPGRRHLHSAAHGDLVVPAFRTKTLGPRAFAISGPDSLAGTIFLSPFVIPHSRSMNSVWNLKRNYIAR